MYDFLIGPMLALSLAICIAGVSWRIYQFFSMSQAISPGPSELSRSLLSAVENREQHEYIRIDSATDILAVWWLRFKRTLPGRSPVFSSITIVFHTVLLAIPLLTPGHNILMDEYLGFNFPALSESAVDRFTVIFIGLGLYFLMRRVFSPTVRSVTTWRDYLVIAVTLLPFITGWLAFHQIFHYKTLLYLHIICGETMLIAIPFTKLAHMPFFLLSRFLIRNELGFGRGTRKWVETL